MELPEEFSKIKLLKGNINYTKRVIAVNQDKVAIAKIQGIDKYYTGKIALYNDNIFYLQKGNKNDTPVNYQELEELFIED